MSQHSDIPTVSLNAISERLEIEYPVRWLYKVIGSSEQDLRGAVMEVIEVDATTLELSNRSSSGKYVSLNVEVLVDSEEQRVRLFEALRRHPAVRMVL